MANRQLILVLVLGAVLSYAAYDYLLAGGAKGPSKAAVAQKKKAELSKKLAGLNKIIASTKLGPVGLKKIDLATKDLKSLPVFSSKNPYYFEGKSSETVSTDVEGQKVVYNGYIEYGGSRLALLNGLEYATGEDFSIQGYKVGEINTKYVYLERPGEMRGQKIKIKVPINEEDRGSSVKIRTVK